MESDDKLLIYNTIRGDTSAFEILVKRYQRYVFKIISGRIMQTSVIEDIAQEVFICAYINLRSLKDPHKFKSWISMIALNMCRMYIRNNKQEKLQSLDEGLDHNTPYHYQDNTADHYDLANETVILLSNLSDNVRKTILLHYKYGYKYSEIAKLTNTSESTVRSRLQHGRAQLKKELIGMGKKNYNEYDATRSFSKSVLQQAVKRGTPMKQASWLPENCYHARLDNDEFVIKECVSVEKYRCEKGILTILNEEGFDAVPKMYSAFDDDKIITTEYPGNKSMLGVIHGINDEFKSKYLSLAAKKLGQLEGIYRKRADEFSKLALDSYKKISAHRYGDSETFVTQCFEAAANLLGKRGVIQVKKSDIDLIIALNRKMSDVISLDEKVWGINCILPIYTRIWEDRIVFTGLFENLALYQACGRLYQFFTSGAIERGAYFRTLITHQLIDEYLSGWSEYYKPIDRETLCRNIDYMYVVGVSEALTSLADQMIDPERYWEYLEWAECYGTFEDRALSLLISYLRLPRFSDDDMVKEFRDSLTRIVMLNKSMNEIHK